MRWPLTAAPGRFPAHTVPLPQAGPAALTCGHVAGAVRAARPGCPGRPGQSRPSAPATGRWVEPHALVVRAGTHLPIIHLNAAGLLVGCRGRPHLPPCPSPKPSPRQTGVKLRDVGERETQLGGSPLQRVALRPCRALWSRREGALRPRAVVGVSRSCRGGPGACRRRRGRPRRALQCAPSPATCPAETAPPRCAPCPPSSPSGPSAWTCSAASGPPTRAT